MKELLLSAPQCSQNYPLLAQLSSLFLHSSLDGMKFEIAEFFKALLESDSDSDFADVFASSILPGFIAYATADKDAATVFAVVELMMAYVESDKARNAQLLVRSDAPKKLAQVAAGRKILKLSLIKLFKALLLHDNEEINQYFVLNDLLAPLFDIIKMNRDNLLSSACFETLKLIEKQSMKRVILYIMDKYRAIVDDERFARNPVMDELREKCELFQSHSPSQRNPRLTRVALRVERRLLLKRGVPENPTEPAAEDAEENNGEEVRRKKLDGD